MNLFVAPQLRDLFAMHALTGLLAWSPENTDRQFTPTDAADEAYEFADAMLSRREKARPAATAPAPAGDDAFARR